MMARKKEELISLARETLRDREGSVVQKKPIFVWHHLFLIEELRVRI